MKILQVTHYMPPHMGGIELVADRLYNAYRDRGEQVTWVASRVPHDAPSREPDGRVRVSAWNMVEASLGVPVPIWLPSGLSVVHDEVSGADVVHVHDALYLGNAAAVWLARRRGIGVLLTQHVGLVPYQSRLLRAIQRVAWATLGQAVLNRASVLVAATPASEAFLRQRCPGRPVHSIPNGLDLERFRPVSPEERRAARQALGLDPLRPLALFVGRFVEKKGVASVLRAAAALPELQWVLLGDGPLRDSVAQADVTAPGLVEASEIHRWYQAADVFVLPSRGEGLPLTVQEAMASGLPCVLTGSETYVADLARASAVVPIPDERQALPRCVQDALARAAELGDSARGYAEARWSESACVEQHLELLRGLVGP